jgi:hypothetical protein
MNGKGVILIKKLLILITFMFIFTGCTLENRLRTPTNIRFELQDIYFDEVEHAFAYEIEINGLNITLSEAKYTITEYGTYQFRVKAIAKEGYFDSRFSKMVTINFQNFDILIPKNIRLEDSILRWDTMGDGVMYELLINNHITYMTGEKKFDIFTYYTTPFEIKIKAHYSNGSSEFSEPILTTSSNLYLTTHVIQYDIFSLKDIDLYTYLNIRFGDILTIEKEDIKEDILEDILISNRYFSRLYLNTLDLGSHIFYVNTAYGTHKITVILKDDGMPYLKSSAETYYTKDQKVKYIFELFNGELTSFTGNSISSRDYQLDQNGVLSINDAYLKKIFEDETRDSILLTYTLKQGNQIIIGYVFIYRFQL